MVLKLDLSRSIRKGEQMYNIIRHKSSHIIQEIRIPGQECRAAAQDLGLVARLVLTRKRSAWGLLLLFPFRIGPGVRIRGCSFVFKGYLKGFALSVMRIYRGGT